jgi:hypothetical protein
MVKKQIFKIRLELFSFKRLMQPQNPSIRDIDKGF